MGTYTISPNAQREHKNKRAKPVINWKDDYYSTIDLIKKILQEEPWIVHKKDVFFSVIYLLKNIPPKTNRINFRTKIKNVSDIPQKDIFIEKKLNGFFKTTIRYKITTEELEIFKKDIIYILETKGASSPKIFNDLPSKYKKLIKNLCYVDNFSQINNRTKSLEKFYSNDMILVNFIKMYDNIPSFVKRETDVDIKDYKEVDNSAIMLYKEYEKIQENIPWIIKSEGNVKSSSIEFTNDKNEFTNDKKLFNLMDGSMLKLNRNPSSLLPVIGVIDSGCDLGEKFAPYIDGSYNYKEEEGVSDYIHGSNVCSLIIANDELNDRHKDGLGNFKVRHFELLQKSEIKNNFSCSFENWSKSIIKIVSQNTDIKVWNLSFGGLKDPWSLNMSKFGLYIDYLSSKYDCLFVVASGNERDKIDNEFESLNFPADSFNALSVGSVSWEKEKVTNSFYSSIGRTAHFVKPEVSHFGGPYNYGGTALQTFSENKIKLFEHGTSFSTPRISRIAADLIHKKNFSVLEAKARIINMSNRETPSCKSSGFGYIKNQQEEVLDLKLLTELYNNKPLYIDLDLTHVDEVSIAACNFVNPAPALSEEYSLSNVEIKLINYSKDWEEHYKTPEEENQKTIKCKYNDSIYYKFQTENFRRLEGGKYFTSHKVYYDLNKYKCDPKKQVALRIRRLNLYDFAEPPPLKVGISIIVNGKNIKENKFVENNHAILNIIQDVEVDT